MKKFIKTISVLICSSILLCGCYGNSVSYSEYSDLEATLEDCENERDYFKEELDIKEKSINNILSYLKTIENNKLIPTYNFDNVWSVGDYFNFSFFYDKELECLSYNIESKDGSSILFIDEETTELQNLFIAFFRSDGSFESYNAFCSGESLIDVPDYNYSYEVILIATINNVPYRATYKFSCKDIKNE